MASYQTFNWRPQIEADARVSLRTLSVRFGDGYEQKAGDGINTRIEQWSLSFVAPKATIEAIKAFIDLHGGYTPFWYRTSNGVTKLFTCSGYSDSVASNAAGTGISRLSATFEEFFS